MSVATLRPNGTNLSANVAVTGASAHDATSDDSDTTYVAFETDFLSADELTLDFTTVTIPAGAIVKSVSPRVRLALPGPGPWAGITVTPYGGSGQAFTVNWQSAVTIGLNPVLGPLTQAEVDGMTLNFWMFSPGIVRVYEAFLDVTYVEQPVVDVTAPVTPIDDTTRPAVTWGVTLDDGGGAQTRYEVKVFTDAQYGAGGFDPDTSTPFETSGEVTGDDVSWMPALTQPDDTYRAYVRVAQTVNGSLHWSEWDSIDYTLAVDRPATPTLTLTEDENDGRIVIDLDDSAGDATTDDFELQRSTDGGATWVAVRLTTDTTGVVTGTSATVYDYEAPNGIATQYRARARHNYSGLYASSEWATGTVTFSTRDVWLKAPERPSLNVVVQVDSYASRQRPARRGVFQPLGGSYPIVVRDTRQSWAGTVRIRLDTDEDQAPIDALLDSGLTLLLQVPASFHEPDRYVQMGDQDRGRLADKGFVEGVIDTLGWVQVAAPTGVVDAWPAGTS